MPHRPTMTFAAKSGAYKKCNYLYAKCIVFDFSIPIEDIHSLKSRIRRIAKQMNPMTKLFEARAANAVLAS